MKSVPSSSASRSRVPEKVLRGRSVPRKSVAASSASPVQHDGEGRDEGPGIPLPPGLAIPDPGTVPLGVELLVQAIGFHQGGAVTLSQTSNLTF